MNINCVEYNNLKKIPTMNGSYGYLATYKGLDEDKVIKILCDEHEKKEKIINRFIDQKFIKGSGCPIEKFYVSNKFIGFIMYFYKDALTFEDCIYKNKFNYQEHLKAVLDCCNQLREIHKRNLVFNDVALRNQLIDKNGGHLVDFDAVTEKTENLIETHYNLTLSGKVIPSCYNLDKLKQALANLSLIYGINFEDIIYIKGFDVTSLFRIFKYNKEIYNLLDSYLCNDQSKPYFDILKDYLYDEEKVAYDRATVYKKTLTLI